MFPALSTLSVMLPSYYFPWRVFLSCGWNCARKLQSRQSLVQAWCNVFFLSSILHKSLSEVALARSLRSDFTTHIARQNPMINPTGLQLRAFVALQRLRWSSFAAVSRRFLGLLSGQGVTEKDRSNTNGIDRENTLLTADQDFGLMLQ
jgi:hypothetical protein